MAERCLECGLEPIGLSCTSIDGEHDWPSEEWNPLETAEERDHREAAFRPWAERGFFVGCA